MNRASLWVCLGSGFGGLASGLLLGVGACHPHAPPAADVPTCPVCPVCSPEPAKPPPNSLEEWCLATCPEGMVPLLLPDAGYPDGWKCVCDPNPGC